MVEIEFSWSECKTMYFGRGQAPNLAVEDELERHDFEPLDAFKDPGVVLSPELKHHIQVDAADKKARNAAFLLRWVFRHLPTKLFLRAYNALVWPVLEYCIQVWSPTTLGDMAKIENVQSMATKLVPAIRMFPYEVRLTFLGLIWVFNILKGKVRLDQARFFTLRPPCNRRAHLLTLLKPTALTAARAHSFVVRVVSPWNKLPQEAIDSPSKEVCKRRLDASWARVFQDCPKARRLLAPSPPSHLSLPIGRIEWREPWRVAWRASPELGFCVISPFIVQGVPRRRVERRKP